MHACYYNASILAFIVVILNDGDCAGEIHYLCALTYTERNVCARSYELTTYNLWKCRLSIY